MSTQYTRKLELIKCRICGKTCPPSYRTEVIKAGRAFTAKSSKYAVNARFRDILRINGALCIVARNDEVRGYFDQNGAHTHKVTIAVDSLTSWLSGHLEIEIPGNGASSANLIITSGIDELSEGVAGVTCKPRLTREEKLLIPLWALAGLPRIGIGYSDGANLIQAHTLLTLWESSLNGTHFDAASSRAIFGRMLNKNDGTKIKRVLKRLGLI